MQSLIFLGMLDVFLACRKDFGSYVEVVFALGVNLHLPDTQIESNTVVIYKMIVLQVATRHEPLCTDILSFLPLQLTERRIREGHLAKH